MKNLSLVIISVLVVFLNAGCQHKGVKNFPGDKATGGPLTAGTAVWWGCASVEVNIAGKKIFIDPFFPFSIKANAILVTHIHDDHCNLPTIKRIAEVSGRDLELIVGPASCADRFRGLTVKEKKILGRFKMLRYSDIIIESVPSFEDVDDIGYIIRHPKTGLTILHMGDNQKYVGEFAKISGIDYLFLSMGKMSYDDMLRFIEIVKPRYVVPMHYRPENDTSLTSAYAHYPSPDKPRDYINELKQRVEQSAIKTEFIILQVGEKLELKHKE